MYLPIWLDPQILKLLVLWLYGRFIEQSCNIIMLIYAQMANFSLVAYFVSIDTATSIRIKAIDNRTILLAESHRVVGNCTPLLFSLLAPPSRIFGEHSARRRLGAHIVAVLSNSAIRSDSHNYTSLVSNIKF